MASVHDHDNDAAFGKELLVYNRPPLWRVIDDAWWSLVDVKEPCNPPPNDQAACVIRALRDWLVPEAVPLPDSVHGSNRFARQAQRQRLRALLTTGAEIAERGDHG